MEETFAHLFRCSQEDKVSCAKLNLLSTDDSFQLPEQDHPRPQLVAEEQRFCTGSHPAAVRPGQSRPSGAPGVQPAATTATAEPTGRSFEWTGRDSSRVTAKGGAGRRRNGERQHCPSERSLTKCFLLVERAKHPKVPVPTADDAATVDDGADGRKLDPVQQPAARVRLRLRRR